MRGLAEYAMRGRRQAILAAFITGLIPFINTVLSPALVALVILRHGWQEGAKVLVWALLPAVGWAIVGDMTHLVVLLGVSALAVILHRTGSWQISLLAAILVGVAAELVLVVNPQFVAMLQQQLEVLLASSSETAELATQAEDMRAFLGTLFGVMSMFLAICLLILARWWQSILYNPGGFGEEFRQLRLDYRIAAGLMLLFVLANFGAPLLQGWMMYFMLPLFFAGLALVHGIAALRKASRLWMIVFYVVLMNPLTAQILTIAALIDSWYNFRGRIKPAV
jgi:hypothetical protein